MPHPSPADDFIPELYEELKHIAQRLLPGGRQTPTLQPTALVNELYLHVASQEGLTPKDLAHFKAIAARKIREILIDYERRRNSEKRGGRALRVTLSDDVAAASHQDIEFLDLEAALRGLERKEPRAAHLFEQRLFGGLTIAELAAEHSLSERTIKGDLRFAKAWLRARLAADGPLPP